MFYSGDCAQVICWHLHLGENIHVDAAFCRTVHYRGKF